MDNQAALQDDPLWYKDAIIYQLHIKSFMDSNDDGIGDFAGLMQKLDYVAQLGVTAIWVLPFYPSPRRDDGYDIAEYEDVSADYGVFDDVKRFIDAAHERGIRVITELVINHTSDQHPWFQRARHAPAGSPERDFYVWSDNDQAYAGTRIIFLDTEKSNWTWDPVAGAYFWHRFYSHQPDLNFDNPAVLDEVLKTMGFWLDLGIDGLRLDAIPYLIEREGTSNENLPETHEVLRKIRASLDARYPDRMLLAEANMWPEDTQQYFGPAADECHMAFHFPLMPRMYMAIAKEDRFPITDILRQTPEIPATCQWAIFLRNHDELTLEMVTDAERDYLWEFYASDRRARINLGIRRRLAPLLERDRRRIELMNSLLFTMPGTPVLYYGDEIGMGDNIHLGDRDGVRTPMQWSPDRNGGFSKADPERLVLPAIHNPLYGYEAVNVEAQQRDPHSLLNWTRRFIAMRRRHRSFGRGTIRFIYPGNRKVLVYLREFEDETILCVANLARAPQAVEIDLSLFEGRVPVELSGGSAFPPVGQLPYLLTMPPYGFYSFELCQSINHPRWHEPAPEPLPEFETLVVRSGIADILADGSPQRHKLEREILPAYLAVRRWFAAKDETLHSVRVADALQIGGRNLAIAEIEAHVGDRTERFSLPLGIAWEDQNLAALPQRLALARVRRGPRVGYLTDAFMLEGAPRGIIEALRHPQANTEKALDFRPTAAIKTMGEVVERDVRWLSAEQSNSSAIVDDLAVVKLVRRLIPGIHPEVEMTRRLTEVGGTNVPDLLGEVVRVRADGETCTMVIVQRFIRNQGDAWTWTLDSLRRVVDENSLAPQGEANPADALSGYLPFVDTLGRRLAEVHNALALPTDDPAFAPVTATKADATAMAQGAVHELEIALQRIGDVRAWSDEQAGEAAAWLLAHRDELLGAVKSLAESATGTALTRIHGDFHLGQVLVAHGDAVILDFEGEPLKSIEERRRKASPLRDVAGLLRSLDYAAAATSRNNAAGGIDPSARAALLDRFRDEAAASFLDGYATTRNISGDGSFTVDPVLLDLFLLEKAAYEVRYEAGNRPDWIGYPTRGLKRIAERLLQGEPD